MTGVMQILHLIQTSHLRLYKVMKKGNKFDEKVGVALKNESTSVPRYENRIQGGQISQIVSLKHSSSHVHSYIPAECCFFI